MTAIPNSILRYFFLISMLFARSGCSLMRDVGRMAEADFASARQLAIDLITHRRKRFGHRASATAAREERHGHALFVQQKKGPTTRSALRSRNADAPYR
jgi:hypothetical protein